MASTKRRFVSTVFFSLFLFALPGLVHAQSDGDWPGWVTVPEGRIYMVCVGDSRPDVPTVIFEVGLGQPYTTWDAMQSEVSNRTLACSYDRLGSGISTPVAEDDIRTPFEMVETLRAAIGEVGLEDPFVLVGHSIAGLILLAYPHLYPEEISGLVFIDASHPEQFARFAAVNPNASPTGAVGAEKIDRGSSTEELSAVGQFGDLPIAVLHQARPTESPMRPIWLELQANHASRSTNSRLIPATESGHFVYQDQPDLVLEAINWVLEEQ